MSSLQEILKNIKKYETAVVQQEFKSKKHAVGLVLFKGKTQVFKRYLPEYFSHMLQEYMILSISMPSVTKPIVLKKDDVHHLLILSYIPGVNLCDMINDHSITIEEKLRLVKLLARWFVSFHSYAKNHHGCIIRGDSNLRNFLCNDKIWGVDFEESRSGKPEEDISQLCVSLLTTDPMFTNEKFDLAQLFIKEYEQGISRNLLDINRYIGCALDDLMIRRTANKNVLQRYRDEIVNKNIFLHSSIK